MSLVARVLEAAGIATVIVGSAQDIVETVGVPRFLFVDYPLGNPAGRPGDAAEQDAVLMAALDVVSTAQTARFTRRMDLDWGSNGWRHEFMRVGADNADALAEAGRVRRAEQAQRRTR